ncbi:MAG: hypothetical protein KAI79_05015 [Bacteroidales bacterium]|nr:hypothetical protein [Bacteroidales bacterium]
MQCNANRWPPVYDFDSLKNEIKELSSSATYESFYTTNLDSENIFQGDILELPMNFPYIDIEGNVVGEEIQLCVVLGNTCDLTRDDVSYTNIIPLDILPAETPKHIIDSLKNYQSYKKMLFPGNGIDYMIDFTKSCTINIEYLKNSSKKLYQLEYTTWVLFHSCIVRYFARDDGRND